MTRGEIQRVAWWVLMFAIGAILIATLVTKRQYLVDDLLFVGWFVYVPVGAVVAWRRPGNALGWIFLLVGLAAGLGALAQVGETLALERAEPLAWWGFASTWISSWLGFPLLLLSTTFTFLLYPDGLPSARWRPVLWLATALLIFSVTAGALQPTLHIGVAGSDISGYDVANPYAPSFVSYAPDKLFWLFFLLMVICTLLAIWCAVRRAWRSTGVERAQMRIFAAAVAFLLASLWPAFYLSEHGYSGVRYVLLAVAFALVPVSCGVAILRYRLYEIDRIIGRTTAYVMVTGVLVGVYVVVVTSLTSLVPESGSTGQADSWAVAVATLVAAALFRPALRWARRVVDRRFNREHFDAEREVEAFAVRLRDKVGGDEVRSDLLTVLGSTVQPSSAALWLKEPAQ